MTTKITGITKGVLAHDFMGISYKVTFCSQQQNKISLTAQNLQKHYILTGYCVHNERGIFKGGPLTVSKALIY